MIGQRGGEAADLQRPLEGHRAAEAEPQSALDELQRLGLAAVEGMRDAAGRLDAAQALQQAVGRAPHMQDHRQPGVARQLQLGEVETLLHLRVQPGHEEVEPDLAHGHQPRIVAPLAQCLGQLLDLVLRRLHHVQRVDAQRIGQAMGVGQRPNRTEVERGHRRQHLHPDAGGLRTRQHRLAIRVEFGRVEVAVGVDPAALHGPMMPCRAQANPGLHKALAVVVL